MNLRRLLPLGAGLLIMAGAALPGTAQAQGQQAKGQLNPIAQKNATADCVTNKQPISCVIVSNHYRAIGQNGEHDDKRRRYLVIGCDGAVAAGGDTHDKRIAGGGACRRSALTYFQGIGGPVDFEAAFRHFGRGCDFGNMTSCAYNAESLEQGRGVTEDKTAALNLYRKACSEKMPIACYKPARMLFFSASKSSGNVGTNPDFIFARKAAGTACATDWQAQGMSCWYRGLYLDNGWGGAKQPDLARAAYKTACELKKAHDVCTTYAVSLTKAPPAERNLTKARSILQAACAAKYDYACNTLTRLSGEAR